MTRKSLSNCCRTISPSSVSCLGVRRSFVGSGTGGCKGRTRLLGRHNRANKQTKGEKEVAPPSRFFTPEELGVETNTCEVAEQGGHPIDILESLFLAFLRGTWQTRPVLIGLFSELEGTGGVQRASRHLAAVLSEFATSRHMDCRLLSLNDTPELHRMSVGGKEFVFTGCERSKARLTDDGDMRRAATWKGKLGRGIRIWDRLRTR